MVLGQTIVCEVRGGTPNDTVVRTGWFPRRGNALTNVYEIIAISGDAQLTVRQLQKNSEETGQGTSNGSDSQSSVNVYGFHTSGIKEMVRYEIELTHTGGAQDAIEYCHFRILDPSWEQTENLNMY